MQSPSPGLFRFSKWVVLATLLLILLGGMVTSLDGGLSVPDWPTTYGYNMFMFPLSQWQGLVFWEHVHRLMASLVGLMTVFLALGILWRDRRKWVRWLGIGAVALVVIQGIMGGLRVTELSTTLAIVHGCIAQAFLCVILLLTLALSPGWDVVYRPRNSSVLSGFATWAWVLVGAVYIQLIIGAVMRHLRAGLAIPTFPLTPEGTIFPMVHNRFVDIAMAHRLWASVVAVIALVVIGKAIGLARSGLYSDFFKKSALALSWLLALQLLLGAWVIWFARPPFPTSLHVLNGALLLMTALALAARSSHLRGDPMNHVEKRDA